MQFARIAQATNNIPSSKPTGAPNIIPGRDRSHCYISAELHTFFSFDPYKLPCSGPYIRGVYRDWPSVSIEGDEESDKEEDGEDVDESDGEFDHGGVFSVNTNEGALGSGGLQIRRAAQGSSSDADGLGKLFGRMSISPTQPRSVIMAS